MKLKKILKGISYTVLSKEIDLGLDLNYIQYDSRKVEKGDLFVAIKGYRVDGHDFIHDAIKNGAKVILLSQYIDSYSKMYKDIIFIKVKNTRITLSLLSSNFYDNPSEKINLIGITGTNGKTSTSYILEEILKNAKWATGLIGTIEAKIDGNVYKTKNTTPESLELQQLIDAMVKKDVNHCIMEVSSHSISLNRVDNCSFSIGIFTNLSRDHFDFHKDMDSYFEEKSKLFLKTNDLNIINKDDPYGEMLISKTSDTKNLTYGIEKKANIMASNIKYSSEGISYIANTPKGPIFIEFPIPGKMYVYNTLAAISCAYSMGIDLNTIKKSLKQFKGIKGRFEIVPTNNEFTVIIDYAHTGDGVKKLLEAVRTFAKKRIIFLTGVSGGKDIGKYTEIGEESSLLSDLIIITTDNPKNENPVPLMRKMKTIIERNNVSCIEIEDRKKAIEYALSIASDEDVVVLAGKGHENTQIIKNKSYSFNERQIVLNYLSNVSQTHLISI